MIVRLTQIDGALPNLALMRLAAWHLSCGDEIHVTRRIDPDLFEPQYDTVYGSAIFSFSRERVERFQKAWPSAILGGSWVGKETPDSPTVEQIVGNDSLAVDYTGHEGFDASIGYTQRGCRLKCTFCNVPGKEGAVRSVGTIPDLWRGVPWPKHIHLLDNDFFGQKEWPARIEEIRSGGFKVCISQGINIRLIHDDGAAALATIQYRNTRFNERQLYTAWDNVGQEKVFFKGVDILERNGIPPKHLMAYMLIGFDILETWPRIWHRFNRMIERGIRPYPMVYNRKRTDLLCFQRWVITGLYRIVPWNEYERSTKSAASVAAWEAVRVPLSGEQEAAA